MIRLGVLAVIACFAGVASADEYTGAVPDRARELAMRGRQLHHQHDYLNAIEAYKAAYVLAPSPNLLFDLAQAYRLAGDCADAAWMYRRFLDTAPVEQLRALAQQHLDDLSTCAKPNLRFASATDDVPVPDEAQPQLAAHRDFMPDDRAAHMKRTGMWLMGGGAASLVLAGVFALDANAQQNAVDDAYANNSMPKNIQDIDSRGRRDATLAAIFGVTGGVAALSGLAVYMIGRHYETTAHVSVSTQSNGAAVGLRWQF